jgi:hypothetical protein
VLEPGEEKRERQRGECGRRVYIFAAGMGKRLRLDFARRREAQLRY